jgi:hypothetical protein
MEQALAISATTRRSQIAVVFLYMVILRLVTSATAVPECGRPGRTASELLLITSECLEALIGDIVAIFKFLATYLVAALIVVAVVSVVAGGVSTPAEAQGIDTRPSQSSDMNRLDRVGPSVNDGTVFVPARPRVIDVGPNGEMTERTPQVTRRETVETRERTQRTIRINSIEDLARLSDEDLRELQREGTRIDVNPFRLRDDVNNGLFRLSDQIRSIDTSFHVSGVRNASGTASTGGSGYRHQRVR